MLNRHFFLNHNGNEIPYLHIIYINMVNWHTGVMYVL